MDMRKVKKSQTTDVLVENHDRESTPRPRRRILQNGIHGACDGDEPERDVEGETGETVEADAAETVPESEPTGASMPSMEEGMQLPRLLNQEQDMLMEKNQKMMRLGWMQKNLRGRDLDDTSNLDKMKYQIRMNGRKFTMDLILPLQP